MAYVSDKEKFVNDREPPKPRRPKADADPEDWDIYKAAMEEWKRDPKVKDRLSGAKRWVNFVALAKRKEVSLRDARMYWRCLKKMAFNPKGKYSETTQVAALKELGNRVYGKPKQEIEHEIKQTLTYEERKLLVLQVLGVGNVEQTTFGIGAEKGFAGGQLDVEQRPAALPEPIPAGQEQVHPVGEVAAGGSDVDVRVKERVEANHPQEPHRPPVQLGGPDCGW